MVLVNRATLLEPLVLPAVRQQVAQARRSSRWCSGWRGSGHQYDHRGCCRCYSQRGRGDRHQRSGHKQSVFAGYRQFGTVKLAA